MVAPGCGIAPRSPAELSPAGRPSGAANCVGTVIATPSAAPLNCSRWSQNQRLFGVVQERIVAADLSDGMSNVADVAAGSATTQAASAATKTRGSRIHMSRPQCASRRAVVVTLTVSVARPSVDWLAHPAGADDAPEQIA